MHEEVMERLLAKTKRARTGRVLRGKRCLMWTGAKSRGGMWSRWYGPVPGENIKKPYGKIFLERVERKSRPRKGQATMVNRNEYVHRVVLEHHLGRALREHEQPHHLCRNTLCVELSHLELTTTTENLSDGAKSRRDCQAFDEGLPSEFYDELDEIW